MENVCEIIYKIGAENKVYGTENGICRITGKESTGISFNTWVRDTFTDFSHLHDGNIISNEALFCFDESSEILQKKTQRDKLQRFRTYSHIVDKGVWYVYTKADKKAIVKHILNNAEIVIFAESGQKHIAFKHRFGMWQCEESHIEKNVDLFKFLHSNCCELLSIGLTQDEVKTGIVKSSTFLRIENMQIFTELNDSIKKYRGSILFNFVTCLLFNNKKNEHN